MLDSDQQRVYLDYAATAPFDESLVEVLERSSWANANSLHAEGKRAATQLCDARSRIARALGAHAPSEIVFTSGGTESDNMALKGLARIVPGAARTHVVVSAMEHHAVLRAADALKASGFKVDRLAPDSSGRIVPDALEASLARIEETGDACALVCVQMVNNEIGVIQPVQELAAVAHAHGALFFTDAVQALGKVDIDLEGLDVDAAAFSGHKIGAPKGIGALYLRRQTPIAALLHGGGQEAGLRSGTSNVPAACAFATAVERATSQREESWEHARMLRERLLEGVAKLQAPHVLRPVLPSDADAVPHIVSLVAQGLEGETVVLRADNAGIALSSGSACSSTSLEPSHVLTALGLSRDDAIGAVRVSFGDKTTSEDIDALLEALPGVLR